MAARAIVVGLVLGALGALGAAVAQTEIKIVDSESGGHVKCPSPDQILVRHATVADVWECGAAPGGSTSEVEYLHVREEQTSGTEPGSYTAGSWATRTLNTVAYNTITGASLASNVITLPPGTYSIHARAHAHDVDSHQARLYDVDAAAAACLGSTAFAYSVNNAANDSTIMCVLAVSAETDYRLEHRAQTSKTTYAWGVATGFSTEVYAEVWIQKLHRSGPPEYTPDAYPAACEDCEEWDNDSEDLTWTDGNASGLTRTVEMDGVTLEVTNETTQARGRWLDAPAGGTDFVMVAKLSLGAPNATRPGCGIWMLLAGSEATPTDLELVRIANPSAGERIYHSSKTSYSAVYTNHTSTTVSRMAAKHLWVWLLIDYDATGNTADSYYSFNGMMWRSLGSQSTAADPSDVGIFCDAGGLGSGQWARGHFAYFRVFTSGAGFTDYIVGGRW